MKFCEGVIVTKRQFVRTIHIEKISENFIESNKRYDILLLYLFLSINENSNNDKELCFMKKKWFVLVALLLLITVGCSNKAYDEAMQKGIDALENET